MNNTISRNAAIKALGEKPFVWKEDDDYALGRRSQWIDDVNAIKNLPSVKSQVIKCCRCRYWRRETDLYTQGFCEIWRVNRTRQNFCSEGSVKEDG